MNGQSSVNNYTQYFVTTSNAAIVHHEVEFDRPGERSPE